MVAGDGPSTVPVGAGGDINIHNFDGWVHVVGDIVGYYADAEGTAGGRFVKSSPQRILDTRDGTRHPAGKLNQGETMLLDVKGQGGVPENATAVVLNVTATNTAADGFLTLWPHGPIMPIVPNLDYARDDTRANLVIVQLPEAGWVSRYSHMRADVIADVMGWYTEERVGDRGRYIAMEPGRLFDTRWDGYELLPWDQDFVYLSLKPG